MRSLAAFVFAAMMGLALVTSSAVQAQDDKGDKDKAAKTDKDDKDKGAPADKGKETVAKGAPADGSTGPSLIRGPDGTEGQAAVVINTVTIGSPWLLILALIGFGMMILLIYALIQLMAMRSSLEKMSSGGAAPPA